MERKTWMLIIGLFLLIDMLAMVILLDYYINGNDNEINYSGNTLVSAGSVYPLKTSSSVSSSSSNSLPSPYEGEYVNFGKKSCGCED